MSTAPSAATAAAAAPAPAATDLATLLDEPSSHRWYRRPALVAAVLLLVLAGAGVWYWQLRKTAGAVYRSIRRDPGS